MVDGLLWFDETKNKPIVEVILDAADRYEARMGKIPTLVLVNEYAIVEEDLGLIIKPVKDIGHHFVWVTGV
jgi:hypothetical protein